MNYKQQIEQKADEYAREGAESLLSDKPHISSKKLYTALMMAHKAGAKDMLS